MGVMAGGAIHTLELKVGSGGSGFGLLVVMNSDSRTAKLAVLGP